jgi:hypothetical protein
MAGRGWIPSPRARWGDPSGSPFEHWNAAPIATPKICSAKELRFTARVLFCCRHDRFLAGNFSTDRTANASFGAFPTGPNGFAEMVRIALALLK